MVKTKKSHKREVSMSNTNRAGNRIVLDKDGRCCPRIFCHQCEQRIRKATEGNAYWLLSKQGNKVPPLFAHKECSYTLERTKPGVWLADELDVYLVNLSNGLGMGEKEWKSARTNAALLSAPLF